MFDEPFRARFAPLVRPLANQLARAGVSPNHVTVMSFGLAIVAAVLVAAGYPKVGLGIWLVTRFGDGLDGVIARHTGQATAFGAFLDITLDMAAYAAMVVGFAVLHPHLPLAWVAVLGGYVIVITSTLALSDGARAIGRRVSIGDRTFQFTPGFAEAGETNLMYVLWVLFPQHVGWLVWIWVALLLATGVQRTHLAWRRLR
ncbi:MAG: CDP-alcohol phosphatidyltransferase family protein [Acidobacteriota bacterium]